MNAEERWEELKKWLETDAAWTTMGDSAHRWANVALDKVVELEGLERQCGWCNVRPSACPDPLRPTYEPVCHDFSDRRKGERRTRFVSSCAHCAADRRLGKKDRRQR